MRRWSEYSKLKKILISIAIPIASFSTVVFLTDGLRRARESGPHHSCISNLKQIGLALHLYAGDYDEHFPDIGKKGIENLEVLVPDYISTFRIFQCPEAQERIDYRSEHGRPVIDDWSKVSYFYREGLTENDPPDTVIMGDKSYENHAWYGRYVLYLDGHVEWKESPLRDLERRARNAKIAIGTGAGLVGLIGGYYLGRKRKRK